MPASNYEFEQFFDREGFNKSLEHFKTVSALLDDFESRYNLADILNSRLAADEIKQTQLSPILYALLVDKYQYHYASHNMSRMVEDFEDFSKEVRKWKAVDIVISYHHPELGFSVINPKNSDHWEAVQSLKRNELVTIYAGGFSDGIEKRVANGALKACIGFLEGKSLKTPEILLKGKYTFKPFVSEEEEEEEVETARRPARRRAPARASFGDSGYEREDETEETAGTPEPQAAAQAASEPGRKPAAPETTGGARRMTPMYSVPVTNELFHNGNVEAWKKIIQSYETKYPGSEVSVFYEGEKIHDINTLFKWGKVKHGSTILFAILGTDIKDVAKLQRYLRQGASPQFEAFLRFPVNTVLKLF